MTHDTPRIIIEHPQWAQRTCTLICGPPGAGKTTLAHTLHPNIIDIGELPPGTPRDRMRTFGRLAHKAGRNPNPNTAVIRGAPLNADRTHQQELCRPASTIIMLTDAATCHDRIEHRARPGIDGRDLAGQHRAVDDWWTAWHTETPRFFHGE